MIVGAKYLWLNSNGRVVGSMVVSGVRMEKNEIDFTFTNPNGTVDSPYTSHPFDVAEKHTRIDESYATTVGEQLLKQVEL